MLRFNVVLMATIALALYISYCDVASAAQVFARISETGEEILVHSVEHDTKFWTPEKLKAAVPPPHSRRRSAPPTRDVDSESEVIMHKPRVTCPGSSEILYKNPSDYNAKPFQTVGKIYFSVGENYYQCSGSISSDQRLVWTAGHCTYDVETRQYVRNVVFIPQYYNNTNPLGQFSARNIFATSTWVNSVSASAPNVAGDYALYEFGTAFPDSFGSFELVTGLTPGVTTYKHYGYPAEEPFDGEWINQCTSLGCNRDPQVSPASVGITCSSTGGSSGGPWLVADAGGDYTRIAGVTSYGYDENPLVLYAAYLTSSAETFFNSVSAGKGAPDESGAAATLAMPYHLLF